MKKGFTLIELMIVMAVMAILVGISMPRFKGMKEEGQLAKVESELRTYKVAVESYAIHHGDDYPTYSNTPYEDYFDAEGVEPGPQIISAVMYDPYATSGREYYYRRGYGSTGENYYAICSVGPDGGRDISNSELNDGILTAEEMDDDIVATNATLSDDEE